MENKTKTKIKKQKRKSNYFEINIKLFSKRVNVFLKIIFNLPNSLLEHAM